MKKIFALVLSLCMVLSTFVAVSAQEMVYDEGVWREGVWTEGTQSKIETVSANSDTDGVGYGNHQNSTFGAVTEEGRTNVHKLTATGATGASSFYMPLKSINGAQFTKTTFPKKGTITWSADVKVSDVTGATPAVALRASSKAGTTPLNGGELIIKKDLGLESGVWKTISGTIDLSTCTYSAEGYATLMLRANLPAGAELYVDNFTWTFESTVYGEWIVDFKEDFQDGMGEVQVGKNGISGVVENGVLKATATGATSHDGLVGTLIKDLDGNTVNVKELNPNAIVKWSIDVKASNKNLLNNGTLNIRHGGWTPSGFVMNLSSINSSSVSANDQWFIFEGVKTIGELVSAGSGSDADTAYFSFRPNMTGAGVLYVDNMKLEIYVPVAEEDIVGPGWEVEAGWEREPLGWITPDYNISYTTKRAKDVGTLEDGVFTATAREVYVYEKARHEAAVANGQSSKLGDGVGYQPWVIAQTNIPTGTDFMLTYNLTTDGLLNSVGEEYTSTEVRARFYDSAGNEINDKYRPSKSVTINTGEPVQVTQVFDPSQLTKDVASVRIVVSVSAPIANGGTYEDSDAYFTISDIVLTQTSSKLALSAEKIANGAALTITNANAQKYSFAGRLLVAEYKTVGGVKELVQFAEVAVDEEIEAGANEVVTAEFENAIGAANSVHVFVWEPASFSPIATFVK